MAWHHSRDTFPRARLAHRCVLCELPIAIGVRHVRRDGFYDGERVTMRMHAHCEAQTHDWTEDDFLVNVPAYFRSNYLADEQCPS